MVLSNGKFFKAVSTDVQCLKDHAKQINVYDTLHISFCRVYSEM